MTDLLRVEDLSVEFRTPAGTTRAVTGLSFRIEPGKTVAIVGESGSGKSVTAQAIMGLLPPIARRLSGRILFADPESPAGSAPVDLATLDTRSKSFAKIRGGRIAMIFQDPTTSFSALHTIGDQIGEALAIHEEVSKPEIRARVIEALTAVGFPRPERAFDAYPFELSGGLCQRAMIAMAMICKPALLIADEPTTALDVTVQAEILKLMRELQDREGTAILLIAHDLGVVANMADEMVVVHHGRIMESGTAAEVFAGPLHPYTKALLAAVPRFDMGENERLKPIREIKVDLDAVRGRRKARTHVAEGGEVLMRIRNLSKGYTNRSETSWFARAKAPTQLAVAGVDLDIQRGECLGLVGESGCGKTTLSKIVVRSQEADAGTVEMLDGAGRIDVLGLEGEALRDWRRRVQYVFQNPFSALNPRMTVKRIVGEPLVIHGIGDAKSQTERVAELLRLVGLDASHMNRYPHSFSGGQRQRIGIARALALEPELIIFDEPVSALDVSIQAQILNLLRDLKSALGLTYLFISHNLAVVDYLADRIAVMAAGRIVEIAPRASLFKDPRHPYTRALITAVPQPDPNHPLDFDAISLQRRSDPAKWGAPFAADERGEPPMVEVESEHWVRAHEIPPRGTPLVDLGGRTPEEHAEIERALRTDPKGQPTVSLDFETGTLEGWSTRRLAGPHSARVQSGIVRSGTKACRFELRPGDHVSQGLRAELRDWYNPPFDTDVWYAFSTYLPSAEFQVPAGTGIVLAQWHDQARLGDPSGKPPLALRCLDGRLRFTGAASKVASPHPDTLHLFHERPALFDTWMDFTVRIRWSRHGDTVLDAFLGESRLFSHVGPLGYRNEDKAPYFKLGVYASGPIDAPVVAYHDEYRRGASREAVTPPRAAALGEPA